MPGTKEFRNGHRFTFPYFESLFPGTQSGQLLHETRSTLVVWTVRGLDLYSREKMLKPHTLALGKSMPGREGVGLTRTSNEVERYVDQPSGLIHDTCRRVDVD